MTVPSRSSGLRPIDAVWGAVVVAAVGAALLFRGDVVKATLTSPAALLRLGIIVIALVLLSWTLRRFVADAAVRAVVMAVPVGAIAWFLVVPYFTDEKVVEALPGASAASVTSTSIPATSIPVTSIPVTTPGATPVSAPATTATPTPAPTPAGPVLLAEGELEGIDHRATGAAALYRLDDGSHIVRLEDIDIQNGPDYFVHLVPGVDRESPGDGHNLGALKGNQGSQNYAIPAEVDLASGQFTVLVWCRAFSVPVANATPLPV